MSWLSRISIANRWVTILIALLIVGGSIFGTLQLKTELMPDIELPYVVVFGMDYGQSPSDINTNITEPVEEKVQDIDGLKHIESTSSENNCFVFATFEYGTNIAKATEAIEASLRENDYFAELMDSESQTRSLIVTDISLEMIPVVWVTMSSENDMTGAEIGALAEDLSDEVTANVNGILTEDTAFMKAVEISGDDAEVMVIPDVDYMNDKGIPMSWLVNTLASGTTFSSLDEVRNTSLEDDTTYTIDDVAEVVDPVTTSFTNGDPSVSIIWRKDPKANTVDVANDIMSQVRDFETEHDEITITTVLDQSDYIESSINDLGFNALLGLILAALVVLLFLWAFRASLIITVTIPLCILIAFLLMYAFDVTINILTLSGLAIAVGRIVDNSIVSLENIYRHLQRGKTFRDAVIDGVKEIAMPITSATIATVIIFVPLILVGGLVGELFRPFGLTVTFALLASLLVALMLVPPLSSFMGQKKVSFEGYDNWYTRLYVASLRWSLGHRVITLVITLILFVASIYVGMFHLGTSFLDTGGDKALTVEIHLPYGNNYDMVQTIGKVEDKVEELDQDHGKVKNYYAYLGSLMSSTEQGVATIQIELTGDANMEEQADALRVLCQDCEDDQTSIKVTTGSAEESMMGGSGLEVRVIGTEDGSLDAVEDATADLYEKIQALQTRGDIYNLESELLTNQSDVSKTWTSSTLDTYADSIAAMEQEWAIMRFGWDTSQTGTTSPSVEINGTNYEIAVPGIASSLSESDSTTIENLMLADADTSAAPMKLSELADLSWGPGEYRRFEGEFAGSITAVITAADKGSINMEVQEMIDDLGDIDGIQEITMGGLAEQMMEGFQDMGKAILIAIGLVFIVMLISFRSWLTPILIMVSMPLASIGAVLALLVTGKTLGMSAMMGILMLVGIVLTNAIVYLTFVDDLRKEGSNCHDALMDAGRIRLRPILMTALTTMVALIPLAVGFGEGVFMAAELGVVVIGGLFSSTLLTLIIVPVLYSLTERVRRSAPARKNKFKVNM